MSYRPKYFALNELVPPDVIQARGEQAWQLMDERILRGADWLREKFGPCVINGKFGGKGFTESGLRNPLTTTGARWSQHKFGRAVDMKFLKVNVKEVYDYILANQPEARANGITTAWRTSTRPPAGFTRIADYYLKPSHRTASLS
jgi:hypothetical protein